MQVPQSIIEETVHTALKEDIGSGDRTASLIDADTRLRTRVIVRQEAVLAGQPWFDEIFRQVDPTVSIDWQVEDGQALEAGQELVRLDGVGVEARLDVYFNRSAEV